MRFVLPVAAVGGEPLMIERRAHVVAVGLSAAASSGRETRGVATDPSRSTTRSKA